MVVPLRPVPCIALALTLLLAGPSSPALAGAATINDPARQPEVEGDRATGQIVVVAVDTLDGRLPGATVTVTAHGPEANGSGGPMVLVSGDNGEVRVEDLRPGDYDVTVEMPGFDVFRQTVTVEAGEAVRARAVLALGGFAEQVAVTGDTTPTQSTDGFTESLSAEEIDQLPDDPETLALMLDELAGGEAEFRVNGFASGELPPKDQIQAIRIRQDPFSPDSMGAGQPRVEIVTRPGMTGWRHEVNAGFRDQSIDARQAFAPTRGEGQTRRLNWNFSGPLIAGKTSIAGRFSVRESFDAQSIVATTTTGSLNDVVSTERGRADGEVRIEHALTKAHTLRFEYQRRNFSGDNLGVGEFSLRDRAFSDERTIDVVRLSDTGTFGTSMFNEFRLEYVGDESTVQSVSDALALNVQNAFTAGGAQRRGGVRGRELEVANSLEFVPAKGHNARLGFEGEWGRSRSDRFDNFTGTFTFASLDDYAAGRPRQFVKRTGDPLVEYSRYEFSWWAHDDWQVRDDVRVGLGLRHDLQGYVDDKWNLAPRASVSWTPGASKATSINAGVGVFNNWLSDDVYEQTLRLDGTRQLDLIVANPTFPDPFEGGAEGVVPPPSIVRFGEDLTMQTATRASVGLEQRVNERLRVRFNVFRQDTRDRLRAINANAPVNGLLPNPAFARITEIESIASAESTGFETSLRASSENGRSSGFFRYRYARTYDDADGALSMPADSNNLAAEWAPASWDIRHRIYTFVRTELPHGVRASLSGSVLSGAPYTVRTGFDDNGDTIFTDRPDGLGRNTERGTWRRNVDLRLGWRPSFLGTPQDTGGGRDRGGRGRQGGGGPRAKGVELYASVSNLFNETNYTRFAGVMTSPLFGQPTGAAPARQFEFGTRVLF
jgi:outer membrane receptor for ferrienterochelin and colicin